MQTSRMHRTISAEDLPQWSSVAVSGHHAEDEVVESTSLAVQTHLRGKAVPMEDRPKKCSDHCSTFTTAVSEAYAGVDTQKLKRQIMNRFPVVKWARAYDMGAFKDDIGCGLTLGIMMIPQGMAYALLVGVAPQYGIYTSIFPTLLYALLGTSPHLSVGPAALVCLLTAEAATAVVPILIPDGEPNAGEDNPAYPLACSFIAFIVGLTHLIMSLLQMGEVIAAFLADPVISGFTNGASILIFMSQLKYFLGVEIARSDFVTTVGDLAASLDDLKNGWSLFVGLCSILILIIFKFVNVKYRKDKMPIPGALVLCTVATFFVWAADVDVAVVGDIPAGLQMPSGDFFQEDLFVDLASAGLVLGVVIYVMTISVGNSLGHKHGYRIQVKQEMLALSAAHLLTPFFGCFPCSASLSRSALAATLGPKTPMHNAFSSLLLILVVYLITPAIRTLPNAALGAIVVFAVRNMLNFKEPKQLYRLNRTDFGLWLCAFTGTLFGGVIIGIGISVSVSVVWLLQKNIRPKMAVLGVLPGTTIYRNLERFEDAKEIEGCKIFRFGAALNFANKDYFEHNLNRLLMGKLLANANPKQATGLTSANPSTGTPTDLSPTPLQNSQSNLHASGPLHPSSSVPSLPDILEEGRALENSDRALGVGGRGRTTSSVPASPSSRNSGGVNRKFSLASQVTTVIIEASSINDIDASAVRMLCDLGKKFKQKRVQLLFANVKGAVRDLLYKSDFYEHVPEKNMYLSLHDAVIATTRMEMQDGKQVLRKHHNRFHRYVPGAMGGNRKTKLQVARTVEHLPDGSVREWRVVSRVVQGTGDVTPDPRAGRRGSLEKLDRSIMFDEDHGDSKSSQGAQGHSGGMLGGGGDTSIGLLQSLSHVARNVPYNVRKRANSQHHDANDRGPDDELLIHHTAVGDSAVNGVGEAAAAAAAAHDAGDTEPHAHAESVDTPE